MDTKRLVATLVCFAAVAATAASADTDVSWIRKMPGLTVMTHKTLGGEVKTVYSLSADVNATVDAITDGLIERGWSIVKSTHTPVAGIESRTLQARQGNAALKLSAQDVGGLRQLTLTVTGGATTVAASAPPPAAPEAPAAASAPAPATAPAPAPVASDPGTPLTLADNRLEGSYDCAGRDVAILGDHCRVTLEGSCRSLRIMGGHNKVLVDASLAAIDIMGGHNRVTWSAAKNPRRPRVTNLGNNNKVLSDQ